MLKNNIVLGKTCLTNYFKTKVHKLYTLYFRCINVDLLTFCAKTVQLPLMLGNDLIYTCFIILVIRNQGKPDLGDICITEHLNVNHIKTGSCLNSSSYHTPVIVTIYSYIIWRQKHPTLYSRATNWNLFRSHLDELYHYKSH